MQAPADFLRFIENQMESEGISLREAARRAGISAGHLSRILSGERGLPPDEIILNLAKALNMERPFELLLRAGRLPMRSMGELSETDTQQLLDVIEAVVQGHRRKRKRKA